MEEIEALKEAHPNLQQISFVGAPNLLHMVYMCFCCARMRSVLSCVLQRGLCFDGTVGTRLGAELAISCFEQETLAQSSCRPFHHGWACRRLPHRATCCSHSTLMNVAIVVDGIYMEFAGHSMGGLIARHAAGHLFDEDSGLIAGLRPGHFIAMATPHLGCDVATSPAQVGFDNMLVFRTLNRKQPHYWAAALDLR